MPVLEVVGVEIRLGISFFGWLNVFVLGGMYALLFVKAREGAVHRYGRATSAWLS